MDDRTVCFITCRSVNVSGGVLKPQNTRNQGYLKVLVIPCPQTLPGHAGNSGYDEELWVEVPKLLWPNL